MTNRMDNMTTDERHEVSIYSANQSEPVNIQDKISLHLTRAEWIQLTAIVLDESVAAGTIKDKYMKAILFHLLRQVYVKLHNKLHSLKDKNNIVRLTCPEASVLNTALLERNTTNYLVISITGAIDQELT